MKNTVKNYDEERERERDWYGIVEDMINKKWGKGKWISVDAQYLQMYFQAKRKIQKMGVSNGKLSRWLSYDYDYFTTEWEGIRKKKGRKILNSFEV